MSAKTSIKTALEKAGVGYTIIRGTGNISGEYLDQETNDQVTKPFIREFFIETLFSYDTEIVPGDVVNFDETGDDFLVMNKTPSLVKDEVILYDGVLYKCNVSGELYRPSGEAVWGSNYRKETSWELVSGETGTTCYGLQTEPLHGIEVEIDDQLGQIGLENHELYISSSFNVKPLFRYQTVSGEYYRVSSVKERRYPGVDVILLEEDTRM